MEDVKWLVKKFWLVFLLLLLLIIAGAVLAGKIHKEDEKAAEDVWEPPVEIAGSGVEWKPQEKEPQNTQQEKRIA